jgi:hypothetical protein
LSQVTIFRHQKQVWFHLWQRSYVWSSGNKIEGQYSLRCSPYYHWFSYGSHPGPLSLYIHIIFSTFKMYLWGMGFSWLKIGSDHGLLC